MDIDRKDKIQESIYRFGENPNGVVSYPVEKHLWYTDK